MCVEGQKGWILRNGNRARQSKDEKRRGLRGSRLANTKKCGECAEVFGVDKLLQTVC